MMPLLPEFARIVEPEILDELRPDDVHARRSRRDLRRVHRAMGSVSILRRSLQTLNLAAPPRRIVEIGAGDGTLLLRLARALAPRWSGASVTLLDRYDLLSPETRAGYKRLQLKVNVERADVMQWATHSAPTHYDLCIASLFLHHFDSRLLGVLLAGVAARADAFVAVEPRRSVVARLGSALIGVLGTNAVTRADAVTSVAAGFTGLELTCLWPEASGGWTLRETSEIPFSHCFSAVRGRGVAHGHGE